MLDLLAFAKYDGWAFFRQAERVFLIRPPLDLLRFEEVNQAVAEQSLAYGFERPSPSRSFETQQALVDFISESVATSRGEAGRPVPEEALGPAALAVAPAEVLTRFLDRVAGELLPGGALGHAKAISFAVLKVAQARDDRPLATAATAVLERVLAKEQQDQAFRELVVAESQANAVAQVFPNAARKYGHALIDYVREVVERGHVFAFQPSHR